MIIYGTRGRNVHVGDGEFFCPRCNTDQEYKRFAVKNYFTLYFIPLIPIGSAGEFVECGGCAATYSPEILTYDPEAELEEMLNTFRRLSVLFLLDVGRCTSATLSALQQRLTDLLDREVEKSDIAEDVRSAQEASPDVNKFFKLQSKNLSDEGKMLLIALLKQVLEDESGMHDTESARLVELGKAMGLRAKHVKAQLQSDDELS